MSTNKTFSDHVQEALKARGMIPADLARETKMESGAVSNILSGKRNPSPDTCKLFAKALNIPLEVVYQWADILPESKEDLDALSKTILHLVMQLDHEEKKNVLEYVNLRYRIFSERNDTNKRNRKKPATKPATA